MRTKVTEVFPETALERVLDALERELIEASDADVLEAADDLGMKPQMKGSAAFLGLRYSSAFHRMEDFFDAKWLEQALSDRRTQLARAALPQKSGRPPVASPSRAASRTRPARTKSSRSPKGSGES